jgi:2-oxo-4-hydroxy-4-carboxy-5-ureidoimidazoline decarboxylase
MSELSDLKPPREDFVAALGNIFEYSPWIAEQAAAARPFAGVTALSAAMKDVVDRATTEMQLTLIKGHPDLANKTQRAAGLTAESNSEQNSAGLDRLSDAEFAGPSASTCLSQVRFSLYRRVRHSKDAIRAPPRTMPGPGTVSIEEICRIAALRLDQLVTADDKLPVTGRLSTHVLDTHSGKPAAGISIVLTELSDLGEYRVVARAVTNSDGRTDQPLIGGRPVPIGRYELMFSVGDYFSGRGVPMSDPPFLDQIPLRFSVSDPEGHLHVPLLVTPWSYATYRGS